MNALLDQVNDKEVRVYRRYGIRSVHGIEQPQEEEITYVLHEDPNHNYTVQLPDEDPESWWLVASMTNAFAVGANHQGHTPIFQVPPHLATVSPEVKLISKDEYLAELAKIDERIKAQHELIQTLPETHVDEKAVLKEKLAGEIKKTGELSKESLLSLLEFLG